MADDALFDTGTSTGDDLTGQSPGGEAGGATATAGVESPGGSAASTGTPSPELTQVFHQLGDTLQGIDARLQSLEAPKPEAATDTGAEAIAEPTEAFQQLYENPDTYIGKVASKAAQAETNRLMPALQTALKQVSMQGQERAKADFDKQFPGLWDTDIGPPLNEALSRLGDENAANEQYTRAIMAGIIGNMVLDPEGQKKLTNAQQQARKARQAPAMLSGGRPAPSPAMLTPEEKAFVADLNRGGVPTTEKQYLASRNRGSSEEDWGSTWMKPETPPAPKETP